MVSGLPKTLCLRWSLINSVGDFATTLVVAHKLSGKADVKVCLLFATNDVERHVADFAKSSLYGLFRATAC
jgi:hypothetical protein